MDLVAAHEISRKCFSIPDMLHSLSSTAYTSRHMHARFLNVGNTFILQPRFCEYHVLIQKLGEKSLAKSVVSPNSPNFSPAKLLSYTVANNLQ